MQNLKSTSMPSLLKVSALTFIASTLLLSSDSQSMLVKAEKVEVLDTFAQEQFKESEGVSEDEQVLDAVSADLQQKSQEAKIERRKAAIKKKRTMESCLTLVRSYYGAKTDEITEFIDTHPTQDKPRLLSKILSQMMIKCNGEITDEQIDILQEYKAQPLDFDYTKKTYMSLIKLDWDQLKYTSPREGQEDFEGLEEGEGAGPVDMTQEEILMSNEVEEYSDEMKREQDEDIRQSMGKTQLAFVDISQMGFFSSMVVVSLVLAFFGGVFYFFYKQLIDVEPDINLVRREIINAKRELKKQQKGSKKDK